MKIRKTLSAAFFLLLLSSCAPRVITDVMKTYPALASADSVIVFEPEELVPNSAEPLGKVSVIDGGMSTKCNYDQVLRLARQETAKVGGNGFALVNHLNPSFWGSSCHQISGMMLRMTDMVTDTVLPNPVQKAIALNKKMTEEQKKERRAPLNTITANVGYGWITSKLYSSFGQSYKSKGGMEWKLEYDRVFSKGLGFGLQYSGFKASLPDGDLRLSYLAPSFLIRSKYKNWVFKYGIGLGVFIYDDEYYHFTRLGTNLDLGMEYMLNKHVGLGISTSCIGASLPKQEGAKYDKDESSGISRINVQGGIRFYF